MGGSSSRSEKDDLASQMSEIKYLVLVSNSYVSLIREFTKGERSAREAEQEDAEVAEKVRVGK